MFQRFVRSTLAVLLTVMIALNCFVTPASASTGKEIRSLTTVDSLAFAFPGDLSYEFLKGVFGGVGGGLGGVVGSVAACYAVDVLIAPVNPPLAAYVATVCPGVGGAVGVTSGYVGSRKMVEAF